MDEEIGRVKCQCPGHEVAVLRDEDGDVSFLHYWVGSPGRRNLRERLWDAWRLVRGQEVYVEEAVLSASGAEKLAEILRGGRG